MDMLDLVQAFQAYLNTTKEDELDDKLKAYLQALRSMLSADLTAVGTQVANEEVRTKRLEIIESFKVSEWRRVKDFLAHLALIFPAHLSRKTIDLVRGGGLVQIVRAFEGITLSFDPCDTLASRITTELDKRTTREAVVWTLPDPLTFTGYDPRWKDAETAIEAYNKIYFTEHKDHFGRFKLHSRYREAKADIYSDFHDLHTRYDLLLVDFAWLPELAFLGNLIPIERFIPAPRAILDKMLKSVIENRSELAEVWLEVVDLLCKGGNDFHYAFPLFINLHGQLYKGRDTEDLPKNFRLMSIENLRRSSLQDQKGAPIVYQLWAHFAANGARPVEHRSGSESTSERFGISKIDLTDDAARMGFSEFLVRLLVSRSGQDYGGQYRIDHGKEVERLSRSVRGWDRSPTFSSELLPALQESSSWQECSLKPPLVGVSNANLCTSIGGYGLAVSRQAVNPEKTMDVALDIFRRCNKWKVEEQRLIPSKVSSFLEPVSLAEARKFADTHIRPRIPFWSHVEELVSFTLVDLVEASEKIDDIRDAIEMGGTIGVACSRIESWLRDGEGARILERLEESVKLKFHSMGLYDE